MTRKSSLSENIIDATSSPQLDVEKEKEKEKTDDIKKEKAKENAPVSNFYTKHSIPFCFVCNDIVATDVYNVHTCLRTDCPNK
jgi:hypothetical protein